MDFDWQDAERRFGSFWCSRLRFKLWAYSVLRAQGAPVWLSLLPGKILFPFDAIKTGFQRIFEGF